MSGTFQSGSLQIQNYIPNAYVVQRQQVTYKFSFITSNDIPLESSVIIQFNKNNNLNCNNNY